jgi:hypothetical protein
MEHKNVQDVLNRNIRTSPPQKQVGPVGNVIVWALVGLLAVYVIAAHFVPALRLP